MFRRAFPPLSWLLAASLLRALGPSADELTRLDGLAQRVSADPEPVLAQLAAIVAWLVLVWLAVGWLAVWGSHARGWSGRACRSVSAVLVPRVLRGVLEGGVGLTVVLSSTPALAASAPAVPVASVSVTSEPPLVPVADEQPAALPSLDRAPTTDLQLAPLPAVPAPALAPATPASADPVLRGQHPAANAEVVVRRGDCLWNVVSRALGPEADDAAVARAWPHWYTANRAVIGDDPDLLLPGQRLVAPDPVP